MSLNKQVLIATRIAPSFEQWLQDKGYTLSYYEDMDAHNFADFEAIVTSNKLFLPNEVLNRFENLKWIGRMGSGMEIIDMDYANAHHITVKSSPDGNANAVAEQALGTLLSLFHNITSSAMEVKEGIWQREINRGYEITNRKIGLVGFGSNGSLFGRKAAQMDMEVFYFDPYLPEDLSCDYAQRVNSYETLISKGIDVLSFHVPQNESTYHYFKLADLALIQKPIYLLNLSRGAIVDWKALYQGWKNQQIIKAGLDVLEQEPLSEVSSLQREEMHEMIQKGDLILTPHVGGYTFEAIEKMGLSLMRQLEPHL